MVARFKDAEQVKLNVILPTNEVGGHEKMLLEWLSRAREFGLQPTVYCRSGWSLATMISGRGIKLEEARYRVRGRQFSRLVRWANFFETYRIATHLPREVPILLAPGSMHASILHLLACVLANRSIVCYVPTAHNAATESLKLSRLRDRIALWLGRRVIIWITIGPLQKSQLEEYWRLVRPVVTIPNRIEVMQGNRPERAKAVKRSDCMTIGYIGRFEPKAKGLDWLERILRVGIQQRDQFSFVFQGQGEFLDSLVSLSERNSVRSVTVVPWGDTQNGLQAIDVLILTSRFEGFPLVAVEALMAGVPVVATRESGLCDVLPEWCVFSFGDEAGMWRSLERLRDPVLRDEAIHYGTGRLEEILSDENYVKGISDVVNALRISAARCADVVR